MSFDTEFFILMLQKNIEAAMLDGREIHYIRVSDDTLIKYFRNPIPYTPDLTAYITRSTKVVRYKNKSYDIISFPYLGQYEVDVILKDSPNLKPERDMKKLCSSKRKDSHFEIKYGSEDRQPKIKVRINYEKQTMSVKSMYDTDISLDSITDPDHLTKIGRMLIEAGQLAKKELKQ